MMDERFNITAEVNIELFIGDIEKKVLDSFITALQITDLLYQLGITDFDFESAERLFFKKLIDALADGAKSINGDYQRQLLEQIMVLESADYDMNHIVHTSENGSQIELVFGKVISPEYENKKLYGGALGLVDRELQNFVESFDKSVSEVFENSALPGCNSDQKFSELKSDFICMDVIKLAGELNRKSKPISVFYSGSQAKQIASLPNVAVFSNLYFKRFKVISSRLGKKLIDDYKIPGDAEICKILVAWLRGHDLGHVFGADNLGNRMKSHRPEYYILHELKSDVVSLVLLNRIAKGLFDADVMDEIYCVFISEMFRYLRKGEFVKFPDSGSAFFMFMYLKENNALNFNKISGKFSVDVGRMYRCIAELSKKLFGVFEKGSLKDALSLINGYGDIKKTGNEQILKSLPVLHDPQIPCNIDFDFKVVV